MAFGTHIAAEGLRLPPVKLVNRGEIDQDLMAIIRNATRAPHYVDGDVQAQLGALKAAETELTRLAERYGVETLRAAMVEVLDYTERMTRAAIDRIPDGDYFAEDYADTDGYSDTPIWVRVRLVVRGDEIEVDFHGPIRSRWERSTHPRQHRVRRLLLAQVLPESDRAAKRRYYRPIRDHRP